MNFIMRASCMLAMCFLVQCQAKVIYSETSYVDKYGNYYDRSTAYESEYEISFSGSGDYGSGFITMWDDEEGDDDDFEGSGSGSGDYGSGFITMWDDEEGDDADDEEGSGSGHKEISITLPVVYEDDLYKNHKNSNANRSIIFPDEDKNVDNRIYSKVNIRELDHISEKEVKNENKSNMKEKKVEISLENGNEEITSEEIKEIVSDLGNILKEIEEEHTLENNSIEKKEEEFYFNKGVISNSETDEFFADPEAVHSIHEVKEHQDSSLGTMQIIMFTSAGILILLVVLLIIILIIYLTGRENKEKYTEEGYIKRIRLISTNSTMKL